MKEDHKKSSMKVFDKWIAVVLGELGDKDITPNRKKKKKCSSFILQVLLSAYEYLYKSKYKNSTQ